MKKNANRADVSDALVAEILDWAISTPHMQNKLQVHAMITAAKIEKAANTPQTLNTMERHRLKRFAENNGFERERVDGIKSKLILAAEWINEGSIKARKRGIKRKLGISVGKDFLQAAQDRKISRSVALKVIDAAIQAGWRHEEQEDQENSTPSNDGTEPA